MTAKVSKKNSFSTLSYQVLWLGSGIRPPRTIPLGPNKLLSMIQQYAPGLNRTFYGIETCYPTIVGSCSLCVLIVPFMELKLPWPDSATARLSVLIVPFMELKREIMQTIFGRQGGLNRTFYGIETRGGRDEKHELQVLIVPFMELKRKSTGHHTSHTTVLIVPFMELKLSLASICFLRLPSLNRTFYGIETTKKLNDGTMTMS